MAFTRMGAAIGIPLLFAAAASCRESVAPPLVARSARQARVMSKTIDWYDCISYDAGNSWECYYAYTTETWTEDWWDQNTFHTTETCHIAAPYCDAQFAPGRGRYTAPLQIVPVSESDIANAPIPTCPPAPGSSPKAFAYCAGRSPTATQRTRLASALDNMRKLGGVCGTLAAIGSRLLDRPEALRIFPQSDFPFTAAVGENGGGSEGPHSWMVLSERMTDLFYDAQHVGTVRDRFTEKVYRFNLQAILAHELDHLNGAPHIVSNGVELKAETTNTRACSGIDIGG